MLSFKLYCFTDSPDSTDIRLTPIVLVVGFEPTCASTPVLETSAYADSATLAKAPPARFELAELGPWPSGLFR